jgi:hypothetical protein
VVAHELAHVVQQRRGGGGVQAKPTAVSAPGDAAEQRADAAAAAVVHGEPVPDVGTAPSGHLHRAPVDTNGGTWDTTTYSAINTGAGVGTIVGATVGLKFTPKDPVLADTIGLTQTVRTLHNIVAGGPVTTDSTVSARNAALNLTAAEGDQGRATDQGDPGDGDTIPNTNPFYAVENSPGHVSATLTDVPANPGFGTHGHRKALPGGGFDVGDAALSDTPRRQITFAGEQFDGKFETTALLADGPQKDTYLGSVEWGYRVDAAGTASVDPAALRVVRAGAPSSQFMAAANKWNNATFTDPTTGTVHNTVDLPRTTIDDSGAVAATGMATTTLITRLATVSTQIAGLAAGTDKTNKEFEKACIEAELRTRNVLIEVNVVSTEDSLGSDEVYVRLTGASGARAQSGVHDLNNGQSHDFLVPLGALVPLTGAIQVGVFDEDSPDGDDHLVNISWASPFASTRNTNTMDGANYNVTVRFER